MNRREEILNGIISFPNQIMEIINPEPNIKELILDFWEALVNNFMLEKTVDTILWYNKINNKDIFNILLYHLSKSGWIDVITEMNYSCIELRKEKILKWVTDEEIQNIRFRNKFIKYRYKYEPSEISTLVKINGSIKETGLVREGFRLAGTHKFKLDCKYLHQLFDDIQNNIFHGLKPTEKDISYDEVGKELLNFYSVANDDFNLNKCLIDSRGRAIYQCTKKIFNPISSKDCRAMIKLEPTKLTKEGEKNVYLFIAELLSLKAKTIDEKIELGRDAYKHGTYPNITRDENNKVVYGEDSYKHIWLDRLYYNLDKPNEWTVPIEIDAYNSILQMIGVLTNNHEYLYGTNLADNGTLNDMWSIPNIPRQLVKKAMTPILYGSSATVEDLWEHNNLEYTNTHAKIIKKEMLSGRFSKAIDFRDFIITNCNPKPTMNIHICDDIFTIECNKYKWQEKCKEEYFIYSQGKMKKIIREVERIPDLKRFKTYFLTLLCHNLDSQVANYIGNSMTFVLPNHDSFILNPNDTNLCKLLYVKYMTYIYKNRKEILKDYLKCIGIKSNWNDVNTDELELSTNALK